MVEGRIISELENPGSYEYNQLKHKIHSDNIPWFWTPSTASFDVDGVAIADDSKDMSYYGHQIMGRPDIPKNRPYTTIDSELFLETYKVLDQIFKCNDIAVSVIYRIHLNATTYSKVKRTPYHTDLELPHKNLLIYMSKFSNGWTYIKEGTEEIKSTPKEDSIIMFDGNLQHSQSPPKINERRIVLVVCFQTEGKW